MGALAGGWTALTECLQEERKPAHISTVRRQFRMTLPGLCYVCIQHPAQQILKGNQQRQLHLFHQRSRASP